ncbi:Regulator of G-protein signaling 10 [Chionoecetes opilio]|uniref:Regulator of G-protein signaling 10 n=1 Tax=Chionoecetes opilio TaxID=41210 RepID=A0A8J4YLY4_CHIOP|nr:Regulator of G-protein signaling 10 [Chionoecetes opilio]
MSSPSKSSAPAAPQTTTTTAATATKTEKGKAKVEKKKLPTKLQAESWTSSITNVLQDPEGVKAFRSYLEEKENESGEAGELTKNIDFYLECEEYKAEFKLLEDKAKKIFEEYLEKVESGVSVARVCDEYGVKKQTVSDSRKAKDKLREYAEAAQVPVFLQVGADKEVGTGGKGVHIGDKLEEEGLEGTVNSLVPVDGFSSPGCFGQKVAPKALKATSAKLVTVPASLWQWRLEVTVQCTH